MTQVERVDFYNEKQEYGELSNFYALKPALVYNGKKFATSEHLYQHFKYVYDGASLASLAFADVIRTAKTPYMSKLYANQEVLQRFAWSRALKPTIDKFKQDGAVRDPNWEKNKDAVMKQVLAIKFEQCKHCREVLLATGTKLLSEHTTNDSYWGNGGAARNGKNMLGIMLMELRAKLAVQKEEKKRKVEEEDDDQKEKKRKI